MSTQEKAEYQKLIRCNVVGPDGDHGTRYTELEDFALWEYMMRNRHQLECRDHTICLWMPADEFERQRSLYEHSGNVEQVDRFDFAVFDELNHYTYTASRFVPHQERDRFRTVMLGHIPPDIRQSDRFELSVTAGYSIEKAEASSADHLVLGLYYRFHDIY